MRNRYFINHQGYSQEGLLAFAESHLKMADLPEWERDLYAFIQTWFSDDDSISIYTSGSTGEPKEIKLPKKMMLRSAMRTLHFFDIKPSGNIMLCLPVKYIAGMMMVVRAFAGSLNLITTSPQNLMLGSRKEKLDLVALVPLQMENLLNGCQDLSSMSKVILGGAPLSAALEQQILSSFKGQVWETYGMTETITHVAVRKVGSEPQVFTALPDITFTTDERECLVISDPYIQETPVITNDRVRLISSGSFQLLGRLDNVINSGGIKIQPEDLERTLEPYIDKRFCITSLPNKKLGQMIVLVVEKGVSLEKLMSAINVLDPHHRPKKIIEIDEIPANANGKTDLQRVKEKIATLSI